MCIRDRNNIVQSISQKEVQKKAMFRYIDSLVIDEPDPCVMIIYDEESIQSKNKILERYSYAELIKINDTQSFVDPEITDSLLVYSKKNFVFLESQNLNIITSVSSLLNSQVNEERDIRLMTTYRSDIYENENISFENDSISHICKASEGSVRDALSLLCLLYTSTLPTKA